MYYCEKCRVKNEWPDAFVRSSGKCECCGEGAVCWDRPSSSLPRVVRPVANNVAAQAGDEPMGICCYGGPLRPKSSCASCAAWQVSPRATADVERDAAHFGLFLQMLDKAHVKFSKGKDNAINRVDFTVMVGNETTDTFRGKVRDLFDQLAAIATTKPGA